MDLRAQVEGIVAKIVGAVEELATRVKAGPTGLRRIDSSVVCSLRFSMKSLGNLTRPRRRAWESDADAV